MFFESRVPRRPGRRHSPGPPGRGWAPFIILTRTKFEGLAKVFNSAKLLGMAEIKLVFPELSAVERGAKLLVQVFKLTCCRNRG